MAHYALHAASANDDERRVALDRAAPMLIRKDLTPAPSRFVLAMVGLPARGKSFISYRVAAFHKWLGVEAQVFNVGQRRRAVEVANQDASYFDPDNMEQKQNRDSIALEVLQGMLQWLDQHPFAVAIFDATNSTVERRRKVIDEVQQHDPSYLVIFIETRCSDLDMLEANIHAKISSSPDYANMSYEDARRDFIARVDMYRRAFEPVGHDGREDDLSYIKMLNLSWHLEVHKVYGRMTTSLLPYLMALHIGRRPVWLICMPQLTIGDADQRLLDHLSAFVQQQEEMRSHHILTCTHQRALAYATRLANSDECIVVQPALNEMDKGDYEHIKREDFEDKTSPEWYAKFIQDPIKTRFPGGECYGDVVRRLMPVVVEIEQQLEPVLVIASLAVVQVLHCYFAQQPVQGASEVEVPENSIIEWRPSGAGFSRRLIDDQLLASGIEGYVVGPPELK